MIRLAPVPKYKRRTPAYTSRRTVPPSGSAARTPVTRNTGRMLFDARPAELPVAELRSKTWAASMRSRLRGKVLGRWQWMRPRLLPLAAATASAFALMGFTDYLSGLAREMPEPQTVREVRNVEDMISLLETTERANPPRTLHTHCPVHQSK